MKLVLDCVGQFASGLKCRVRAGGAVIGRGTATADARRRERSSFLQSCGYVEDPSPVSYYVSFSLFEIMSPKEGLNSRPH